MPALRASMLLSVLLVVAAHAGAQSEVDSDAVRQCAAGHRLRTIAIAGATAQAIAVAWPHDRGGEPGARLALAHAVAAYRAHAADFALPAGTRTVVEVGEHGAVFTALLPDGGNGSAAAWLAALAAPVDPDRPTAGDDLARIRAAAALACDDADWLYPGLVLAGQARLALGLGCGLRGAATALQATTDAAFAAAIARGPAAPLSVAVVGSTLGCDRLVAQLDTIALVPEANPSADLAVVPAESAWTGKHPRVDAAYVAAAFAAPRPTADSVPFAVGIAVLRARAERRFRSYRGRELAARAPFVAYDWLAGDPVVLLYRRGGDDDPARPRADLEALLAELRQDPPDEAECAAATAALTAEWAPPPWSTALGDALAAWPAGMLPRARAMALLASWGLSDAAVRILPSLAAAPVRAQLAAAVEADRIRWQALVPATVPFWSR